MAEGEASFFPDQSGAPPKPIETIRGKEYKLRLDCIIILEVLRRYNGPVAM